MDKSLWPDGEWKQEPDMFISYEEKYESYSMIIRQDAGYLCGYIGLTYSHPLYEITYSELGDYGVEPQCHWGLTLSNFKNWTDEAYEIGGLINHKEEFEKVWWVGFDCDHYGDYSPNRDRDVKDEVYRNIDYVKKHIDMIHEQYNCKLIKDYYYALGKKKALIESKMNKLAQFKLRENDNSLYY